MEDPQLVKPINQLYHEWWGPWHNFFLPSMKLVKKWRVGARWRRQHDRAQTAYQRLLELGVLTGKKRRQLRERFQSLDPFALHDELEQRLRPILAQALEVNAKDLTQPPGGG